MNVLVVGGGITGLSAALNLGRAGATVTVVEIADGPRDGGYMIDFFGVGFDAAEEMDLLGDLAGIHRQIDQLVFFDRRGRESFRLEYDAMRKRMFGGRHFNFMRGDLEHILRSHAGEVADIRFGTTIETLEEDGDVVVVGLSDGSAGEFDLVIGADGVHSTVRSMLDIDFEMLDLGHVTAAFMIDGVPDRLAPEQFSTMTAPGRMVAVYPTSTGEAATFFVHRSAEPGIELGRGPAVTLTETYGGMGWVVDELLDGVDWNKVYFDSVAQVLMSSWVSGRVALAGDAAWCVTLLAGQGASLGVAGGRRLASAVVGSNDIVSSLKEWESHMRPVVESLQGSGRTTASWFVPESRWRMVVRDLGLRASTWPLVGRWLGQGLGGGRSAS